MIVVIAVAFAIVLAASLTVVPSLAARIYRRPAPPSRRDGTHGTFDELTAPAAADRRVKVVRLARNFGQSAAT